MSEIKELSLENLPAIQQFFGSNVRENHPFVKSSEYFLWKYYLPPYRREYFTGLSAVGAFKDGKLRAFLGLAPVLINCFGEKQLGISFTDWLHPSLGYEVNTSRVPVGMSLLLRYLRDDRFSLGFAFNTTPESLPVYNRLAWTEIENLPRYFLPIDSEKLNNYFIEKPEILDFLGGFPKISEAHNDAVCEDTFALNEYWDEFYWEALAPQSWGVARTSDFLRWRYLKNPLVNYRYLHFLENNQTKGLLIFRDEISSDGALRLGRVLEIVGSERAQLALIQNFVSLLIQENFSAADFISTLSKTNHLLEECGFQPVFREGEYIIPHLFQPLNYEVRHISCCFGAIGGGNLTPECRSDRLYFTKGDGDLDRPICP